jgi:hypothetical protein
VAVLNIIAPAFTDRLVRKFGRKRDGPEEAGGSGDTSQEINRSGEHE